MSLIGVIAFFTQDIVFLGDVFEERITGQQNITRTLHVIVPEIRSITQSAAGDYPVALATESALTFYSDIDKDGAIEKVRYFLENTTFKKGTLKPTGVPLEYNPANEIVKTEIENVIDDEIFLYYNNGYTGVEGPMPFPVKLIDIRIIGVKLTTNDPRTIEVGPVTFKTQAIIRNLRDNF
ncbi:MAG: hypothetical protein A3F24_00595 [Candidatus Colwellbacteria bacterium RIFCSPHIGHO2_12_FULL_44_17]|nr:MAG: hypothetical protein A3F24_00595 [Candidatus Colwellbacteria bacterium RIFCSPHIGHO2_12_FULL_44_17]